MKTTHILLVFLICISCKQNTTSEAESSEIIEEIETVKNSNTTSENYKKLQGTWVNIDAPLSSLTFDENRVINTYNGIDSKKNITFSIGNTCTLKAIKNASKEEDRYINTTGDQEECYYIVQLEDENMVLGFWGIETPLRFRRQD